MPSESHASTGSVVTDWRLRTYTVAAAVAVLAAALILLAMPGNTGGDLSSFYAAGVLVRSSPERLYDLALQDDLQRTLTGVDLPVIPFAYMPGVAVAYAPLTLLPFTWAYVVHSAVMLCALAAAVRLAGTRMDRVHRWLVPAMAVALVFCPLGRSVFGGQNTALSLLLATGAFTARSPVARGVWLGLWLFKPQLALPVLLAASLREPRVLLGAAPVAAAWYALGASACGMDWPITWTSVVASFVEYDRAANARWSISVLDLFGWCVGPWPAYGLLLGGQVAIQLAALRNPRVAVPLVATAAPLVAPHALFYDGGLAMLGLLVVAERDGRGKLGALFAAWAVSLLPLPGLAAALCCVATAWMLLRGGPGARDGDLTEVTR